VTTSPKSSLDSHIFFNGSELPAQLLPQVIAKRLPAMRFADQLADVSSYDPTLLATQSRVQHKTYQP
jgi:hypothetical protein